MMSIKNQSNPFKFMVAVFLMRTGLSKFFVIKQKHYRLRFYPTKLSRALFIDPHYWDSTYKLRSGFFWNYLGPGDIVIDVGSHIGQITLESAVKIGSSGKVYSIEPHPRIFKYLQGNIKLNHLNNVIPYNCALGDKTGTVTFVDNPTDPSSAVASDNEEGIEVPLRKLDEIIPSKTEITLMKLFAVGYEKFVLLGAGNTLNNVKCIHFRKYRTKFAEKFHYNYIEVFKILLDYGFQIFHIRENKTIVPIPQNYDPKGWGTRDEEDFVALRDVNDFLKRTEFKINS